METNPEKNQYDPIEEILIKIKNKSVGDQRQKSNSLQVTARIVNCRDFFKNCLHFSTLFDPNF